MATKSNRAKELLHRCGSEIQIYKNIIVWKNVIKFSLLHLATLYGLYLMFASAKLKTTLFALFYGHVSTLGITAGAHRLWSHRAYKAKWPLRVFLCILNSIAFQNCIYEWCRDHRVHHKFSEKNADPHNIKRGFFFAHMGWLLSKKHPDVIMEGKKICMDDLWADPIVTFQKRFYFPLVILFSFYLPTMIPVWCWRETALNSFLIAGVLRYCLSLHITWLVNSAAHKYGNRPFDKNIEARESPAVSLLATGEGWHNYHHTFPWDYAASELGYSFNLSKLFIDAMAKLGLAYDLKTANRISQSKKLKSGDGTRIDKERYKLFAPKLVSVSFSF